MKTNALITILALATSPALVSCQQTNSRKPLCDPSKPGKCVYTPDDVRTDWRGSSGNDLEGRRGGRSTATQERDGGLLQ